MATMTQSVAMENGTKYIRSLPKHLVTWDSSETKAATPLKLDL